MSDSKSNHNVKKSNKKKKMVKKEIKDGDNQNKKTGPREPYAINNLLKVLSNDKIREIKLKYYIEKVPKYKLAKEIGLSHQLMDKFLERIGKLTANDLRND